MRALIVENGYSRGALAACRALAQRGWSVSIASPSRGLAASSRFASSWHQLEPARWGMERFAERLAAITTENQSDVLFAAGDEEILALSSLRSRLAAVVPYPEHQILTKALDKMHLHDAGIRANIAVPHTQLATSAALESIEGPVIVKARAHGGIENAVVPDRWETYRADDREEARAYAEQIASKGGEAIIQSVVEGKLMAVTTLLSQEGEVLGTVQQEASRTWPLPAGISVRAVTVPVEEELAGKVHQMLRDLGWFGLAEVQFLRPSSGHPYLIDLNGRFYGSLALAIAAGTNFPDMWGRLALGYPVTPASAKVGVHYQWLEGDLRRALSERRGGLAKDVFETLRSARGATHSMISTGDPRPAAGFSAHLLGRAVRKARRSLRTAPVALEAGELSPQLRAAVARFEERFGDVERVARLRPHKPCVVLSRTHVGYIAYDERTTSEIEQEARHLEWASGEGISCPKIEEQTAEWLIVRRVRNDMTDLTYVHLTLEAADKIENAAVPPVGVKPGTRSSSRSTLIRRGSRMLLGGVRPIEFLKLRKAYASLPKDALGHGDFHPNNVLFDSAERKVNVIDWTHLGTYPRLTDHAVFWALTQGKEQRDVALREVMRRSMQQATTITVLRWIALRSLIELVTSGPRKALPKAKLKHARTVLKEARSFSNQGPT